MAVVNVDAKALEWAVALFYSQDKVGLDEWYAGVDQHSMNQELYGLPPGKEGRLIAKIFLFRLIYGGTANGFANDPSFASVSRKKDFWQEVIDKTYRKYKGLAAWHRKIKQEARQTGRLITPSGREYRYEPKDYGEGPKWDDGAILNYPVNYSGVS